MPRVARDLGRDRGRGAPDGVVEPGREHRDVGTRPALGDEPRPRAAPGSRTRPPSLSATDTRSARRSPVEPVARCRPPRRPLQLDGGLGLVAHRRAPAEEHRDRVEQAAHAGGGQGRRPAGEVAHVGDAGGVDAAHRDGIAGGELTPDRRHAPRLPDRRRAAGHGHRPQMADPLEAVEVGDQHLAAPERAVGAVPEAVERQRDAPGRARSCSTMHAATWAWWCCTATVGRSRSTANLVDRYSGWRSWATTSGDDAVQRRQVVERLEERLGTWRGARGRRCGGWRRRRRSLGDRDRALQLGPDGQHRARGARPGSRQRLGRVARATAGAPARGAGVGPHHRVVAADVDGPVVGEEGRRPAGRGGRRRRRRRGRSGSSLQVAARHHQRPPRRPRTRRWWSGDVRAGTPRARAARVRPRARSCRRRGAGRARSVGRRREDRPRPVVEHPDQRRRQSTSATITANGLSSRCLAPAELGDGVARRWRRTARW